MKLSSSKLNQIGENEAEIMDEPAMVNSNEPNRITEVDFDAIEDDDSEEGETLKEFASQQVKCQNYIQYFIWILVAINGVMFLLPKKTNALSLVENPNHVMQILMDDIVYDLEDPTENYDMLISNFDQLVKFMHSETMSKITLEYSEKYNMISRLQQSIQTLAYYCGMKKNWKLVQQMLLVLDAYTRINVGFEYKKNMVRDILEDCGDNNDVIATLFRVSQTHAISRNGRFYKDFAKDILKKFGNDQYNGLYLNTLDLLYEMAGSKKLLKRDNEKVCDFLGNHDLQKTPSRHRDMYCFLLNNISCVPYAKNYFSVKTFCRPNEALSFEN